MFVQYILFCVKNIQIVFRTLAYLIANYVIPLLSYTDLLKESISIHKALLTISQKFDKQFMRLFHRTFGG